MKARWPPQSTSSPNSSELSSVLRGGLGVIRFKENVDTVA